MNKLLTWSGDINKAIRTVLQRMNENGLDFATWTNSQTGSRFIAKKLTIEKMYKNKFENAKIEISDSEIVKLQNSGLTTNEIMETGSAVIAEGFSGKERTEIDASQVNLVEKVLHDKNFDCSVLFNE